MIKLTPKQLGVAKRLLASNSKFLMSTSPHPLDLASGQAIYQFFIPTPYSEEDTRSVRGMIIKGALISIGDGDYELHSEITQQLQNSDAS